jgi:hypothetical protein
MQGNRKPYWIQDHELDAIATLHYSKEFVAIDDLENSLLAIDDLVKASGNSIFDVLPFSEFAEDHGAPALSGFFPKLNVLC